MRTLLGSLLRVVLTILWWPLSFIQANAQTRSNWKETIQEKRAELSTEKYVHLDEKGDAIIGLLPNGGYWVARRDGFSGWRCTVFSDLDITQKATVVASKEKALEWVSSYTPSLEP